VSHSRLPAGSKNRTAPFATVHVTWAGGSVSPLAVRREGAVHIHAGPTGEERRSGTMGPSARRTGLASTRLGKEGAQRVTLGRNGPALPIALGAALAASDFQPPLCRFSITPNVQASRPSTTKKE
jgi:hypothetical protein